MMSTSCRSSYTAYTTRYWPIRIRQRWLSPRSLRQPLGRGSFANASTLAKIRWMRGASNSSSSRRAERANVMVYSATEFALFAQALFD